LRPEGWDPNQWACNPRRSREKPQATENGGGSRLTSLDDFDDPARARDMWFDDVAMKAKPLINA
jgi:hypothetical protein